MHILIGKMKAQSGDLLLSLVLPHIDAQPVSKASARQTTLPSFWRQKLIERGFTTVAAPEVYKQVYITLYTYDFSAEKAYLSACERNMHEVVAYLTRYVQPSLGKACVLSTTSAEVIRSTTLSAQERREVLFSTAADRNLMDKFRELLSAYGADEIAGSVIGLAPIDVQIEVARVTGKDTLFPLASHVGDSRLARVFEQKGYIFPIAQALELQALVSVREWIMSEPPPEQMSTALDFLFTLPTEPSRKIVGMLLPSEREKYLVAAAARNWGEICEEILVARTTPTHAAIVAAIRMGALSACIALSPYRTMAELRLARSLGKMDVYNALLG